MPFENETVKLVLLSMMEAKTSSLIRSRQEPSFVKLAEFKRKGNARSYQSVLVFTALAK